MGWQVREGMVVRTADGERLGIVVQCGEDTFVIEKGLLLPRDFTEPRRGPSGRERYWGPSPAPHT